MFDRRPVLWLLAGLALGAAVVAGVREHRRAVGLGDGPEASGVGIERCLACHDRPWEDPGGAHAAIAVGCSTCHLGDPLAYDAVRAHRGMEPSPGALETVGRTCGREGCHPREAGWVAGSLMATGRGFIAVNRWVFGEQETPDGLRTFADVLAADPASPAEDHLRRLCAGCHLGTRPANRDDAVRAGGSGCGACHAPGRAARRLSESSPHPAIDARVPDDRCLGCHSRSGRISLSWQGLAEIRPGDDPPGEAATLHDGRPARRLVGDVHRERGMTCIDCHPAPDLMGDGRVALHQEDAVSITCEACHGPVAGPGESAWGAFPDGLARDVLRQRGEPRPSDERVRLDRFGAPLWNVRPAAAVAAAGIPVAPPRPRAEPVPGKPARPASRWPWTLVLKTPSHPREGRPAALPVAATPDDPSHRMKGHERLACQACHAAWIPTCTTCHTRFDAAGSQWDFGVAAVVPGAWLETSEGFSWAEPALGVRAGRIVPTTPGMVMDLDASSAGGPRASRRLYAALDPHTTRRESRSCASCHLSAWALGLGAGSLSLGPEGPAFVPTRPDPARPGAARDGWTTLFPEAPAPGTRTTVRSLDRAEQRRVLGVGPCLACHPDADDPVHADFATSLRRLVSGATACTHRPAPWQVVPLER